jgi:hypothetical protein
MIAQSMTNEFSYFILVNILIKKQLERLKYLDFKKHILITVFNLFNYCHYSIDNQLLIYFISRIDYQMDKF